MLCASSDVEPVMVSKLLFRSPAKFALEISYGVYLYHVEAEDIGETTGKFAVIK